MWTSIGIGREAAHDVRSRSRRGDEDVAGHDATAGLDEPAADALEKPARGVV
jgi:hypothetical protein